MKCLFWTDGFAPRLGGIEVQGRHFLNGMRAKGHAFQVFANQDQLDWPGLEWIEGMSVQRFQFNAMIEKKTLSELKRIDQALNEILTNFKPDLIHLYTCTGGAAIVYLLMRARFLNIPTLLTLHGIFTPDYKIDPLIDRVLQAVDHICCVSNALQKQVRVYAAHAAHKTRYIHNGLALPDVIPTPLTFAPPTLACVSRLSAEKGIDLALHAVAIVKKTLPNIRFIIAGDGPERAALMALTASLQLQDNILFTGALTPEQVPEIMNQACVILVPSRAESFGLTALQGSQMARPVIASRVGGLPEIIQHEHTGLLVEVDDLDGLVTAILHLITDPSYATTLGLNGRSRALAQFGLQAHIEEYATLYQNCINQKDATYAAVS